MPLELLTTAAGPQSVLCTQGARGWGEHLHERLRWQLGRHTDVVVNTGVSGWSAPDVLREQDWVSGRFRPDVLSVSLGTNDCLAGDAGLPAFREAMRKFVEGAGSRTQVVLHTPVLVSFAERERRAAMPAYRQAVRELAAESGALPVDHEAHRRAHHQAADPIGWLDDPAPPNAAGQLQMAQVALRAMGLGEIELP
ncbi:SGNH/GDSL hydrolase family protein [Streptomyces sp. SID14478]|uniref:SGNH/GDSL hydrolase family protein n=1 Tax=Streptomyces sp. SID14478 TaxID=2706073 RepID=UPI0013DEEC6A|nr:GDSL-type esterase/lipase family protein [Streptomyces sp. SID14478]NEB80872.1 SGNH/GDSL hydrolase family protein [Streptomyces sp. SID14478]